ncbi:MAG: HAD family hydrolase [Anaerolineae bacterium]|nr:HAD family hydrolase [Anaerolineae bacterium]
MSVIKAILFDFDNTLTDYVALDLQGLRRVYTLTDEQGREDEFVAVAVEEIMACHAAIEQKRLDPLKLHDARLRNTCVQLHLPWRDEYRDAYQRYFVENTVVYPEVLDVLRTLSETYVLGIVTNAYDAQEQRRRIDHCGVGALMRTVVIAGDSGYSKPDPAIFRLAACRLGVESNECIYVGDSERYDIAGAHAAGMATVKITPNLKAMASSADRMIGSISELSTAISSLCNEASTHPLTNSPAVG